MMERALLEVTAQMDSGYDCSILEKCLLPRSSFPQTPNRQVDAVDPAAAKLQTTHNAARECWHHRPVLLSP